MVLVVALFAGFLVWAVAIIAVDARALGELRRRTARRERAATEVVEEAERWLQEH